MAALCLRMLCLACLELLVQVSGITTSPLPGAQAEWHQDREGPSWTPGWGEVGEHVLSQVDSPSGERLKPFTQMMKVLDPVPVLCSFFIFYRIWHLESQK